MDADVRDRLLEAAERIVGVEATELRPALVQAADVVADATGAEMVDVFLHDPATDRGPGIEPALAARIFTRFARGPGSQGIGLGLFLAREIAVAHGRSLEVQTAPGRGSTFTFRLPAHPP